MSLVCLQNLPGMGAACSADNPFGVTSALFLTAEDFSFASFADFADKTKWDAAIIEKKIFPIQDIDEVEDSSEENVVYTAPNSGKKSHIRNGQYSAMYKLQLPLELHKILAQYSLKKFRMFKLDLNGNIGGTTPDGTTVQGVQLQYFSVGKLLAPTGDTPSFTPIDVQESDESEWNKRGVYFEPTWGATSLAGITGLTIAQVGSASTDTLVVDVYYANGLDSDGAVDQIAYSGLTVDSFALVDGVLTLLTAVESTNVAGRYTLTASATLTPAAATTIAVIPFSGAPAEADPVVFV